MIFTQNDKFKQGVNKSSKNSKSKEGVEIILYNSTSK